MSDAPTTDDEGFDDAQLRPGESPVTDPRPDPAQLDMAGRKPDAFAAIGDTVYVAANGGIYGFTGDEVIIVGQGVTPDQWLKFNGGYAVDPTPEQAAVAERAVQEALDGDTTSGP